MALTKEQLLLLNNLMYMDPEEGRPIPEPSNYEGMTIADWVNSIDVKNITDKPGSNPMTTADEVKHLLQAIKNDPQLMRMTITETHVDKGPGGGGGQSLLLIDKNSNDAVVLFQGTDKYEWKDDFTGGNVSDTDQQKNALEWYRKIKEKYDLEQYEITLTGHSKGGNKSKYITVLDDSVDHCVSFDGQGFSDKFFDKYSEQISQNQHKIENHNVDYDYVNLLLSDIGERHYYKGQRVNNFLENHCCESFFQFDENGNLVMVETEQGPEMAALDEFLNSILRSLDDDDRTEMLDMIGDLIANNFSYDKDPMSNLMEIFNNPKYEDDLAYLLAYLIRYEQENPDMAPHLRSAFEKFGLGDYTVFIDMVDELLHHEFDFGILGTYDFNDIMGVLGGVAGFIEGWDWLVDKILHWIEDKTGAKIDKETFKKILRIADMTGKDLKNIRISNDRADRKVKDGFNGGKGGTTQFYVDPARIDGAQKALVNISSELKGDIDRVSHILKSLDLHLHTANRMVFNIVINSSITNLRNLSQKTNNLANTLADISSAYTTAESRLASKG